MFHFGQHKKSHRSLQKPSKVTHRSLVNYCVLCTDFFLYTVTHFLMTIYLFTQLKLMSMKTSCSCSQVTKKKCQICVNLRNLISLPLHFYSFPRVRQVYCQGKKTGECICRVYNTLYTHTASELKLGKGQIDMFIFYFLTTCLYNLQVFHLWQGGS